MKKLCTYYDSCLYQDQIKKRYCCEQIRKCDYRHDDPDEEKIKRLVKTARGFKAAQATPAALDIMRVGKAVQEIFEAVKAFDGEYDG